MLVNQTRMQVERSGCVRVRIVRIKETRFHISVECDFGPEDGLTLEELDQVQREVREAAERTVVGVANEYDLSRMTLPLIPGC